MVTPDTRRIDDATPFHATTDGTMAALSLAAAAGMMWWFEMPLDFDVNSPSFNPAVFLPVALVLYGIVQGVKYLRARSTGQRFGASVFEMQGQAVAIGGTLRGQVKTSRDLAAPGGFRLRLRCIEEVRYSDQAGGGPTDRRADRIRWEATDTVQTAGSRSPGVPVRFDIPASAIAEVVESHRVRWTLEVEATVDGARYEALFGVPITTLSDD